MRHILTAYYIDILCESESSNASNFTDQCYLFLYWVNEIPRRFLFSFHRFCMIQMIRSFAIKSLILYWKYVLGECDDSLGPGINQRSIDYSNRMSKAYVNDYDFFMMILFDFLSDCIIFGAKIDDNDDFLTLQMLIRNRWKESKVEDQNQFLKRFKQQYDEECCDNFLGLILGFDVVLNM
ncbi:MAG: hypothetical protein GY714_14180 [Desulfobacterales bacterium]|nr:hypothetical protein [Desulfobacterales bacterium]